MSDVAQSRRRWRLAFLVLLPLSLLSTGYLFYVLVDRGLAAADMASAFDETHEGLAVLRELLPALSPHASRSAVLTTLRQQHPTAFITATDSTVGMGGLVFRFATDGHLRAVEPLH